MALGGIQRHLMANGKIPPSTALNGQEDTRVLEECRKDINIPPVGSE